MASSFTSVPVIDVSALVSQLVGGNDSLSSEAIKVCEALHRACQDVGFFYVSNHGVSKELQSRLAEAAKVFFHLDEATKSLFSMEKGGRAWRGWFRLGDELTSGRPDQKEGYYFGTELGENDPRVLAKLPMHGANLFPDQLVPELRHVVLQVVKIERKKKKKKKKKKKNLNHLLQTVHGRMPKACSDHSARPCCWFDGSRACQLFCEPLLE